MPKKSNKASRRYAESGASATAPPADAVISLTATGLHYSSDDEPGIHRRRNGKGFIYVMPDGVRVTDAETLIRIRSLAIPPAYESVWICASAAGHLQATGFDARGRKQYRYHPDWRAVRDVNKFDRMLDFGRVLARVHRRVAQDLRKPGMSRERVLATVVRLLERTLIRVGNEQYVRENKSYGLTTLRNRHVAVRGDLIHFEFRGKAGIRHRLAIADRHAAAVVRRCLDLPSQELFQYVGDDGALHGVTSSDVNDYIRAAAGEAYTAKDFRTWYATIGALDALIQRPYTTQREAQAHVKAVLAEVSRRLGNTPAMCRKCYVHPGVLEGYLAGRLRVQGESTRSGRERLLQLLRRAARSSKDGSRMSRSVKQAGGTARRRGSIARASP